MKTFDKSKNSKEMYTNFSFGQFQYDRMKFNQVFIRLFEDIKNKKQKRIYDIGCGRGYWFDLYQRMGFKKENITGIDQSTSAIKELKQKEYSAYEADALQLPFSDEVSDITVANGVIHHTVDPFKAFKELCRITKSGGGVIIITVYNLWHPYRILVHKLTFPLRYYYWNISKRISIPVFYIGGLGIQIIAILLLHRFLKKSVVKTMVMDEIFSPVAKLFSRRDMIKYGNSMNVTLMEEGLYSFGTMRYAKYKKQR